MKLLIVEDDLLMQQTLIGVFNDHQCVVVSTYAAAELALSLNIFGAAFLDIQLSGPVEKDGMLLLKKIQDLDHYLPCIMISGIDDPQTITKCLDLGAVDYVAKGTVNPQAYKIALLKALNWKKIVAESPQEREKKRNITDDFGIKGSSQGTNDLREQISRVSNMPGPFLIMGETGVGKELVARALWAGVKKNHRPFIAVNCASLPENLVESELFGYEKGAFTGAMNAKTGLFEAANGGDIFLDEIGDLGLDLQAKLLRVLQEKKVRRLGSDKERPVDFRIIAATNIDLVEAVAQKEFREDIFYRLNVYSVRVPALRDRIDDVPELLKYFLNEMGISSVEIDTSAQTALKEYLWPGNVRQLKAFCLFMIPFLNGGKTLIEEKYFTQWKLNQGLKVGPPVTQELSAEVQVATALKNQKSLDIVGLVESFQKSYVDVALKLTKNNRSQAAKILGVSRQRLSNWLSDWGIF